MALMWQYISTKIGWFELACFSYGDDLVGRFLSYFYFLIYSKGNAAPIDL